MRDINQKSQGLGNSQSINKNIIRAIGVICFSLPLLSCEKEESGIKPELKSITESVYASATVQPQDLYDLYPTSSGIIDKLYIEEGDVVKKEALVAKISSDREDINIEKTELQLRLAEDKYTGSSNLLTSIKNEIDLARTAFLQDSINYERQKRMWDQGIGSRSSYENQKLNYELSIEKLEGLAQKYQQTKIELRSQYELALKDVQKSKTDLGDSYIKSKLDGRVYRLYKEEGELASLQEPIAKIGLTDQFTIELLIDEIDIAQVSIGQLVLITLDAYQGQVYRGTIVKIFPTKDISTQTFSAEAVFADPPKALYSGLSGEANIVIAQKEEVLTIPIDYLIDNQTVQTIDGPVKVEIGLKSMEFVEVLSGIDTSVSIIKP